MARELWASNEEETRAVGRALAGAVAAGDLLGLYGPLGAGKTCLVRGLAEGLGVPPDRVRSPSFTLVHAYNGGRLPLYHVDLFRLEPSAEDRLALREYLYGEGVCVVEWFDRLGEAAEHLTVELRYAGTNERRIRLVASGSKYERLIEAVEGEPRWR